VAKLAWMRGWVGNLLLSAAVSLALLVALEGGARLLEPEQPRPRAAEIWTPGAGGHFYTLKKRPLGWPPNEINAEGFRDRTHAYEKPDDFWRVAILGDSVSAGFGLEAEQALARVLERQLEADGERIEVLSMAVRGWSTRQQRIAYHRTVRAYAPDQVLVAVCLNDITELAIQLRPPPGMLVSLHRHSALVRRLVDASHREERQVGELFRGEPPLGAFFDEVRELRSEVVADGAELGLVVLPYRFQVMADAPVPRVQGTISDWCASVNLRCLDLLPALSSAGPGAFLDENHLSQEGTLRAAAAVRALLPSRPLANDLLPALRTLGESGREAVAWLEAGRPELPPERQAAVCASLVAALRAPSARARTGAAWALGSLDTADAATPALSAALTDPSEAVAAAAARALGRHGARPRETMAALFHALDDPRQGLRWAAADALNVLSVNSPAWLPELRRALASPDTYVRHFAAWSIGNLGEAGADAAQELLRVLAEEEESDAPAAAAAARRLGPALRPALPEVVADLKHPEARRRIRAARTLGLLRATARETVPALIDTLADPDPLVRGHAALALGRIGEPTGSVPALRAALRDEDPWVREEATRAIGQMLRSDEGLALALVAALEDPSPGVRRQAARSLARLAEPRPQVLEALTRAAQDADERVRREAARTLEHLQAP